MESAFGSADSAWTRVGSQSESSTEKTLKLRQPIRIEHRKNHSTSSANQNPVLPNPSRYPIRIEYYVTRVVITSLESSRLGWRAFSALGSSRLAIAYLITWGSPGPPTTSAHTLTTHDANEPRYILTKTSKVNILEVKSVLESIFKRLRKSAIRENFNLKRDPQMKKTHSNKRCNYFHKHSENERKFPSFMS